jgi:hypothetical protein
MHMVYLVKKNTPSVYYQITDKTYIMIIFIPQSNETRVPLKLCELLCTTSVDVQHLYDMC